MSGGRGIPGDANEIAWRQLADAEFAATATAAVETWLAAASVETRLLVALDDELELRLTQQRARRRRSGAKSPPDETDLRPLCHLLLMAMERGCAGSGSGLVVTRALRLAGLHGLCSMLLAEPIAGPTWSHAHRMYARAEAAGTADQPTVLGPSDTAFYLRLLLLSTLAGNGLIARQIDKSFDWLSTWSLDIVLDKTHDSMRHHLGVDLEASAGLQVVNAQEKMAAPRYFDHLRLAARVSAARSDYFRQISVATIGLYLTNPLFEFHDALNQLSRYWDYVAVRHSGQDSGRKRIEEKSVAATSGYDRCVRVVTGTAAAEQWTLIDLSPTGAGFMVTGLAQPIEKGALTVFADPGGDGWIVGAAVRVAASAHGVEVGVRRMAVTWRPVRLQEEVAVDMHTADDSEGTFGFFVFGDEARGLADSIILRSGAYDPTRTYTMRPGRDLFEIRLSRVIQSAGDWERVGFDVLKRFTATA